MNKIFIVTLINLIEKYLKDSITDKARLARIDQLSKLNLIPPRIYKEQIRQDSLFHAKDSAYLIAKGYIKILKDTTDIDEEEEQNLLEKMRLDKLKKGQPKKDSAENKNLINRDAILLNDKKKPAAKQKA